MEQNTIILTEIKKSNRDGTSGTLALAVIRIVRMQRNVSEKTNDNGIS